MLGNLLHVEAFVFAGLIAEQVPDADAVRCRGDGCRQRLQRARADGGDHGGLLAGDPPEGARCVRRFDLAAHVVDAQQAGVLVDAQHLAHIGRAVPENDQESLHILAQQPQHDRFRQGDVHGLGQ